MIRIRAFRAVDELDTCKVYMREHMEVLKVFGITKITTANDSWMQNPNVYVIFAEMVEGNIPVGGARIHLYDPSDKYPLPMDDAIREFDPTVKDLLSKHNEQGTAEICGLWNSRIVAGWGIGTIFLSRAGIAFSASLPIKSMFVLCGEHTIGITLDKGFQVEERLGNKGTFYYPKEGLVATAAVFEDLKDLSHAKPTDREVIESLRSKPNQTRRETTDKMTFDITYKLDLNIG